MKTEIEVLGGDNRKNEEILKRGARIIRDGGLVAFPTETVYGLGANALDASAAQKIYAAKGRPSDNPLIIHIAKADDAAKYAYVPKMYTRLAERFLPGALTVIMPKRENIPYTVTGGLDSVAVRVPSNIYARRLIELSEVPIAAPSANLSGRPSPTEAAHVIEDMNTRIDMIIDGGSCEIGLESTIIKLNENGAELLRPGGITVEMLEDVLGEIKIDKAVTGKLDDGEKPLAPGMKYRHYAPRAELALVDGSDVFFYSYVKSVKPDLLTAVIAFEEDREGLLDAGVNGENILLLGARNNTAEHAAKLFALLRLCDERGYTKVYSRLPGREGISLAVYNRILKASGFNVIKEQK